MFSIIWTPDDVCSVIFYLAVAIVVVKYLAFD